MQLGVWQGGGSGAGICRRRLGLSKEGKPLELQQCFRCCGDAAVALDTGLDDRIRS